MWSLSKIVSFLQRFCTDESVTTADVIDLIKLRYESVYTRVLKFFKTEKTFPTVSGTKYYYLNPEFNVSLGLKFFNQTDSNYTIKVRDLEYIYRKDPDESETNRPKVAAYVELSPVKRQPNESSDAGTVGIKSTSPTDVNKAVTIEGIRTVSSQQIHDTEEISTNASNGTTFVAGTKTGWHTFRIVSKEEDTAGAIIVSDTDGGNVYAVLDPYARRAEYQKWRLWPTPDSAATIKVLGYRKPVVPTNDSSVLDVPTDFEGSFVQGLRADVHSLNFDMIMSQKYEAKFEQGLEAKSVNDVWEDDEEMSLTGEEFKYDPLSNLEEIDEDIEVL